MQLSTYDHLFVSLFSIFILRYLLFHLIVVDLYALNALFPIQDLGLKPFILMYRLSNLPILHSFPPQYDGTIYFSLIILYYHSSPLISFLSVLISLVSNCQSLDSLRPPPISVSLHLISIITLIE